MSQINHLRKASLSRPLKVDHQLATIVPFILPKYKLGRRLCLFLPSLALKITPSPPSPFPLQISDPTSDSPLHPPAMSSISDKLEESISDFFSQAGACTTRTECDAFANRTFGGPVKPVPHQGLFSYTVAAANDSAIVQFRDAGSPLDTQMLATIQDSHPDLVAGCSFHGTIGSSPALLVYAMNMVLGDNYLNISLSLLDEDLDHQLATVHSLARFVHLCIAPQIRKLKMI